MAAPFVGQPFVQPEGWTADGPPDRSANDDEWAAPPQLESWSATLDALEVQLDRQEEALQRGVDPPPDLVVGFPDLALTEQERIRAIVLLERQEALLDEMVAQLARRRRRLPSPYR
ncbi:MAG: hypothetical protein KC910_26625 [Candidatus Eremiobacteraeota bacterium]|nr:hypothetical protein [Candidatus Eremiobacteraeota bacterium]